jgi:hypothetical protein
MHDLDPWFLGEGWSERQAASEITRIIGSATWHGNGADSISSGKTTQTPPKLTFALLTVSQVGRVMTRISHAPRRVV